MISVVIPLYNKQESIVATLQSVLAQTYKEDEVVVVNDGSTDNSAQVVQEFFDKHPSLQGRDRVRLISQPNAGVSAARNTGIIESKGEYIAFLDGDDLWDEKYLDTLHKLICDYPDATIYGIGCAQIKDGEVLLQTMSQKCPRGYVEDIWKNYPGYWTGSSSSSRAYLIEIGMFDSRMTHGEDLDVWWRLLLRGKGAYDSTVLAYYRQDAENRAMNRVIPLDKHIPFYMDKYAEARANNKEFRRFFDREMIYRLYPYLCDKRYCKQAKLLAKQMDYSLQKWTMKFRMNWPRLYKVYNKLKARGERKDYETKYNSTYI